MAWRAARPLLRTPDSKRCALLLRFWERAHLLCRGRVLWRAHPRMCLPMKNDVRLALGAGAVFLVAGFFFAFGMIYGDLVAHDRLDPVLSACLQEIAKP